MTTPTIPSRLGTAIVWLILILTLVVSPTLGSASSVLTLLLTLALLPVLWQPGAMAAVRRAPMQIIFAILVLVLTVVYAITARKPEDVLFFANFLALPLSAVIYVIALAQQGHGAAVMLARLCLAGAVVGLGFALYDVHVLGLSRAQGLIGNPNLMPRIALPLGFVALVGILLEVGWRRWLYLLGPFAALLVTVLTESRGAFLAVPPMLLLAAILLWRNTDTRKLVIVGGGAAALALVAGLALQGPEILGRFASIAETVGSILSNGTAGADSSTDQRLDMYSAGIVAFGQAPWLGWGWANLGNAAAAVDPANFAFAEGTLFLFHNDAVNFGVAAGVVGLLCLLAILVAPTIGALATPRDRYFGVRLYVCVQLGASYLVFGLTDSTLGYDAPTTLYAYLAAMVLGVMREPRSA